MDDVPQNWILTTTLDAERNKTVRVLRQYVNKVRGNARQKQVAQQLFQSLYDYHVVDDASKLRPGSVVRWLFKDVRKGLSNCAIFCHMAETTMVCKLIRVPRFFHVTTDTCFIIFQKFSADQQLVMETIQALQQTNA